MRGTRRATAMVIAVLAVIGLATTCSSSDDSSTATTLAEKSAEAPETTASTAKPTTTTTLGPPPPAGVIPFVDLQPSSPDGTSPSGSGCTPQAPTLPDGQWFGQLRSIDTVAGTLGFDLECFFVGAAANAAAAADGSTEIPVPNDVWIRNESDTVRTQHAVSDVAVGLLAAGGNSTEYEPTAPGLAEAGALIDRPVWLEVQDGWVVAIQQQFFP